MAVRIALFNSAPKPNSERKPEPKPERKPEPKPKPKPEPKPGPKPKLRAKRRPRPKKAPVLQRRTLGPVLARAVVLAVAIVCMVGFAVALAKVTLVPSPGSSALIHTNFRPGASIRAYLDQPAMRDTVKQIGGNIVLGVPFGVLLPTLFPRVRGLVRVLAVTALVMVVVEVTQGVIVEGRAFDIDDVLLNTLGALLGYLLLGWRLGHALHPRPATWWQPIVAAFRPGRRPVRKRP
jgi:hypothetical protein